MYENGQTSYVEMLLSADSFTDFLNAVEYITQISQYDRKMLKEYQNMQVTIADTQMCIRDRVITAAADGANVVTSIEKYLNEL